MKTSSDFIGNWGNGIILFSYICFAVTVLILLIHEVRIIMTSDPKKRYDYVNTHEIRYFWYAIITFIAGTSLFLTVVISPLIAVDSFLKPFVDLFFLAGFVVVSYYVLSHLVRTLYPKFLENRLMRIRSKPRFSMAGNRMRKLSVEEGAVHLEEGGFTNTGSEIHSIEYDVWVDEKTGEKKIEKYLIYQHADKCEECGYYTMKIDREEIVKHPTSKESGVLIEHYRCGYCKHRVAKEVIIAPLSSNMAGAN